MDRVILHSDCNNFYASVEQCLRPELRGKAIVVVGDKEARHGIVLAKSYAAKACGIKTGDVIWEAEQKCPNLIKVPADFNTYLKFSKKVRAVYEDYTDQIEAFGIDECWLDITGSLKMLNKNGDEVANEIRERVKKEVGITVSIGVSWNKIFAKLGSDMKKPDAVTVITKDNYKELVWGLPCEELLYVGRKTKVKLNKYSIYTIGDLANCSEEFLKSRFNKWGSYLHTFANGWDETPVARIGEEETVKSIGNSLTNYKDMKNNEEVLTLIYLLSESVAARLRESNLGKASTVHLYARSSALESFAKQGKLSEPTNLSKEVAEFAFKLFREAYVWDNPVRSIGISISGFTGFVEQMTVSHSDVAYLKQEQLEKSIDKIRKKHGSFAIQRGIIKKDLKLSKQNIKEEHVIHPEGYFKK